MVLQINAMKVVLVTGGVGFIGSHLIDVLLKDRSYGRVVCVDNLDPRGDLRTKEENLERFRAHPKFSFHKVDIADRDALSAVFEKEKPTHVAHLASMTNTRNAVNEPDEYVRVNVTGTLNVLACAQEAKIKKYVFASSSSVYGNGTKLPFVEEAELGRPLSAYGASKKMAEMLGYAYHHNAGFPVVQLRIFNAIGERQRPDLVLYRWTEAILLGKEIEMSGSGMRSRDYTYVGDIVRAFMLALGQKDVPYAVLNISSTEQVNLKKLLRILEKTLGMRARVRVRPSAHASVERTHGSVARAKKVLGWKPEVSTEEGVARFVDWYKTHRHAA